jgi:hypothetical protein
MSDQFRQMAKDFLINNDYNEDSDWQFNTAQMIQAEIEAKSPGWCTQLRQPGRNVGVQT